MTTFSDAMALEDHKSGAASCFTRCKNTACRRFVARGNTPLTTECECITTVEDQWRGVYTLKYGPGLIPPFFEWNDEGPARNLDRSFELDVSEEAEVGNVAEQCMEVDYSDAGTEQLETVSEAKRHDRSNSASTPEKVRKLEEELADVRQKLELEVKGRKDETRRRKDVEDCLGVVYEELRSVDKERAGRPYFQRWVARLLPATTSSGVGHSVAGASHDN